MNLRRKTAISAGIFYYGCILFYIYRVIVNKLCDVCAPSHLAFQRNGWHLRWGYFMVCARGWNKEKGSRSIFTGLKIEIV